MRFDILLLVIAIYLCGFIGGYINAKKKKHNITDIDNLLMSIDDLLPEDHMIKNSNSYKKLTKCK